MSSSNLQVIDGVRAGFAALLEAGPPASGFDVLSVPELPPGMRLAIDSEAHPNLIIDVSGRHGSRESTEALSVKFLPLGIDGIVAKRLIVACPIEELFMVFDQFVAAIADLATETNVSPDKAAISVIEKWQALLSKKGLPPGGSKVASVIAEMLVLVDCLKQDPLGRVDQWVGPSSQRHDFRRGKTAVEVKSTLQHTGMKVTINGADQLLAPKGGELYIHFVRLEPVPGGDLTLGTLTDRSVANGADRLELHEKLAQVGIPITRLSELEDHQFELRDRITIQVGPSTPRIVPASFVGGETPKGTDDITYKCDLGVVADEKITAAEWQEVVGRLAGDKG